MDSSECLVCLGTSAQLTVSDCDTSFVISFRTKSDVASAAV